jgi:hypothetical protein
MRKYGVVKVTEEENTEKSSSTKEDKIEKVCETYDKAKNYSQDNPGKTILILK